MDGKSMFSRVKKRLSDISLDPYEKSLALAFLAALLLGLWLPQRIAVATSPSLNHRVFFLVHSKAGAIKTGDYLVVKQHDTSFIKQGLNKETDNLMKQVGCSPSQSLIRDVEGQFFCNDEFLGRSLITDSHGNPLPQFNYSGTVPDDSYFLIGSHPRSFDSKYFGFIHSDDILHKAVPLW
ncbi:MAG: S26 family signal peptidase [Proteobacteria bacterium]|nr:S26 family signal peptidase [Pseudomonadota bacterium]